MSIISESCMISVTVRLSAALGAMNLPPATGNPRASNIGTTQVFKMRCTKRKSALFLPSSTSLCTSPSDRAPLSPCTVVSVCPRMVISNSSLHAFLNSSKEEPFPELVSFVSISASFGTTSQGADPAFSKASSSCRRLEGS